MVLVNFWRYPDPYQRFLIRIRIRIRNTGWNYQRSTALGWKDIGIRIPEFVTKTQFLSERLVKKDIVYFKLFNWTKNKIFPKAELENARTFSKNIFFLFWQNQTLLFSLPDTYLLSHSYFSELVFIRYIYKGDKY